MKKSILISMCIIALSLAPAASLFGGDSGQPIVSGAVYFDTATGHKYIKNSNATYSEYSQKGKLLRSNVANTQPNLSTGQNIIEIDDAHFMVYEKKQNDMVVQQVLPVSNSHPQGWRSKLVVSTVTNPELASAEAYGKSE